MRIHWVIRNNFSAEVITLQFYNLQKTYHFKQANPKWDLSKDNFFKQVFFQSIKKKSDKCKKASEG